jgi:NAD(P)-dependent dehydrogenase (short-subunit alcohol dehydrogenase family)
MTSFDGKVVIITGGASGIGAACARDFASQGATVIIADVNAKKSAEVALQIESDGGITIAIPTDVSDNESVQHLVKKTVAEYGRLDYAILSAGIFLHEGEPDQPDLAMYNRIMDINLKGTWLCIKHMADPMRQTGNASIVTMTSVLGLRGAARAALYVAAKHGVVGLTKSAAMAYATQGIRVNGIAPGIIATPMEQYLIDDEEELNEILRLYPMGRVATPDEVTGLVLWLCSEQASYTTGAIIPVDGGHMAL